MVTESMGVLRVAVVGEDPAGAGFLADICRMLEAVARRRGCQLHFRAVSSTESRATVPSASRHVLDSEAGIHRAQVAEADSPTGRISTIKVAVDASEGAPAAAANAEPIRTYNYPMRRCTVHATGETLSLDVVLSGAAG
jgi:protein subunit release factor A